jgi:hypothetical protein|tara:strand:+ start:110 stop:445 length:336 start_codon:yes stop_codon:yes gene_type:complete
MDAIETSSMILSLENYMNPLLTLLVSGVIALWFKDMVGDIVASIRWKMKPGFEPGHVVILEGEEATIISIGLRETIFEIDNGRGKVWRYIENKRMPMMRLEKVIVKSKSKK